MLEKTDFSFRENCHKFLLYVSLPAVVSEFFFCGLPDSQNVNSQNVKNYGNVFLLLLI